jgi:alkylhydroperoxidase family enzyme
VSSVASRLETPDDSELDRETRELLLRARSELGQVPGPLRALAAAPHALRGAWALVEAALLEGQVPPTTKELVALAATAASPGAESLASLFRAALEQKGVAPAILDDLAKRGESGRLPERTQRVLAFARRAALQPALLADDDFRALRREGTSEPELAELAALGAALAFLIALARATHA